MQEKGQYMINQAKLLDKCMQVEKRAGYAHALPQMRGVNYLIEKQSQIRDDEE